jgi:hypothetical protein
MTRPDLDYEAFGQFCSSAQKTQSAVLFSNLAASSHSARSRVSLQIVNKQDAYKTVASRQTALGVRVSRPHSILISLPTNSETSMTLCTQMVTGMKKPVRSSMLLQRYSRKFASPNWLCTCQETNWRQDDQNLWNPWKNVTRHHSFGRLTDCTSAIRDCMLRIYCKPNHLPSPEF